VTSTPHDLPAERAQVVTLGRAFFARFFDNDISDGSQDLTRSFIWLIAALAIPGAVLPNWTMAAWAIMANGLGPLGGVQYLWMMSTSVRVFAIGLTMISVGAVAVVTWHALMIDRRDVLVLGGFPVRQRTLVIGKLLALVGFFALLFVGMHTLGSLSFGLQLGGVDTVSAIVRIALVHFAISVLAGASVLLLVVGVQSLALLVLGPRLFVHASPVLQMGLVALLLGLFLLLPFIAAGTPGAMYRVGLEARPWVLFTPPVWFVGLYDAWLGSNLAIVERLGALAWWLMGGSAVLASLTYPLAFRKVVRDALLSTPISRRPSWLRRVAGHVPDWLTRDAIEQATLQFTLSVFSRVGIHRLVLSTAVGIALAVTATFVGANTAVPLTGPTAGLLSLGTVTMLCLLLGVRIAMSIPAELPGAWMFLASTGPRWTGYRTATRRFLWVIGVLPPVVVNIVALGAVWGFEVSAQHSALLLAEGLLLTELLLIGVSAPPCTTPYEPGRSRIQSHWPVYAIALALFTIELPRRQAFELVWGGITTPVVTAFMLLAALICRRQFDRRVGPLAGPDPKPYGVVLN
jgi:hypothetical protein